MFKSYLFCLIVNVLLVFGLTFQQGCKMIFFLSPTGNCRIDLQNTKELFFDLVNFNCLHVVFRFGVLTPAFVSQTITKQKQSTIYFKEVPSVIILI